jgi:hypothetical protein
MQDATVTVKGEEHNEDVLPFERSPYLIDHWLRDEALAQFKQPVDWEVMDESGTILYGGTVDFSSARDRSSIVYLTAWCVYMNHSLFMFKHRG